MKHFILYFLLCTFSSFKILADDLNEINKNLKFYNICGDIRIKSSEIYKTGNKLSDPIISLNSMETITLSFDDVAAYGENFRDFYYTIIHCDADWNEENIPVSDYMTGYPENQISTILQSVGTSVTFSNYKLTIPNKEIRLKVSGNYLLKIYEINSRSLVLQKGFCVVEQITKIYSSVRKPMNGALNSQQLELKVSYQNLRVNDPYVNIKVRTEQNSMHFKSNYPIPAFTEPQQIDYTRSDRNIYPGGNEYRSFDIRNLKYSGQGVNYINLTQGLYHVILNNDVIRSSQQYMTNKDINGKFVIGSERSYNEDSQSDYVDVYFSLNSSFPVNGRVFIYGELSNWSLCSEFEMHYNQDMAAYENSVLLKQGYYNYKYVVLNENGQLNVDEIEGSYYDTENVYGIYVYYKGIGDRFDRLVGYEKINSHSIGFMN